MLSTVLRLQVRYHQADTGSCCNQSRPQACKVTSAKRSRAASELGLLDWRTFPVALAFDVSRHQLYIVTCSIYYT